MCFSFLFNQFNFNNIYIYIHIHMYVIFMSNMGTACTKCTQYSIVVEQIKCYIGKPPFALVTLKRSMVLPIYNLGVWLGCHP